MNATLSRVKPFEISSLMKMLLLTVFASAGALSVKAAYDLTKYSEIFPAWFVPSFILAITGLITLGLYFVFQTLKIAHNTSLLAGKQASLLWLPMLLSFLCTTSVHGFYPFHTKVFLILPAIDSVMKINYALVMVALLASITLAFVYIFRQMRHPAVIGLMLISLILLIPNDNCSNPFNYWWIERIGASPLMYVPNMYAALFVTCGLHGVNPKAVGVLAAGICTGSLLLGIGHQLGIIW